MTLMHHISWCSNTVMLGFKSTIGLRSILQTRWRVLHIMLVARRQAAFTAPSLGIPALLSQGCSFSDPGGQAEHRHASRTILPQNMPFLFCVGAIVCLPHALLVPNSCCLAETDCISAVAQPCQASFCPSGKVQPGQKVGIALKTPPRMIILASVQVGLKLAEVGKQLEQVFEGPQDVEGVLIGDDVHLVQTRPQP